ncbi:MAG TPA: SCE4755 family polysaccharide monooxygenase-like protein [Vicinamibacterales bacterium]|nr:SCE4755 family polysaccharide monooxygenase-like protein [Vicinamibacterales bacterium]
MTHRLLLATAVAAIIASFAATARAHFVLVAPAASLVQNRLGDPQKIAPCGGVSGNPARGTPPNPGVPSGAVTNVKGGTNLPMMVQETIYHPGHYRVALARTMQQLPPDPVVTTAQTEKGTRSQSAVIQNPPVAPVLLDGIFAHTERPTQNFEAEIPIPNIECKDCVLQVIEFMADHPGIAVDGGHSYHHCAILNITADPSKPIDKRW